MVPDIENNSNKWTRVIKKKEKIKKKCEREIIGPIKISLICKNHSNFIQNA